MNRWKIHLFNNWGVKLGSLIAAALIWALIKHHIAAPPTAAPAPVATLPG